MKMLSVSQEIQEKLQKLCREFIVSEGLDGPALMVGFSIAESAKRLNVNDNAVTKKVKRGTLEHFLVYDGRQHAYITDRALAYELAKKRLRRKSCVIPVDKWSITIVHPFKLTVNLYSTEAIGNFFASWKPLTSKVFLCVCEMAKPEKCTNPFEILDDEGYYIAAIPDKEGKITIAGAKENKQITGIMTKAEWLKLKAEFIINADAAITKYLGRGV